MVCLRDIMAGKIEFLIIGEGFHPWRPERLRSVHIECSMPFKLPELFKANSPDGAIQEKSVNVATMAVNAEISHGLH